MKKLIIFGMIVALQGCSAFGFQIVRSGIDGLKTSKQMEMEAIASISQSNAIALEAFYQSKNASMLSAAQLGALTPQAQSEYVRSLGYTQMMDQMNSIVTVASGAASPEAQLANAAYGAVNAKTLARYNFAGGVVKSLTGIATIGGAAYVLGKAFDGQGRGLQVSGDNNTVDYKLDDVNTVIKNQGEGSSTDYDYKTGIPVSELQLADTGFTSDVGGEGGDQSLLEQCTACGGTLVGSR